MPCFRLARRFAAGESPKGAARGGRSAGAVLASVDDDHDLATQRGRVNLARVSRRPRRSFVNSSRQAGRRLADSFSVAGTDFADVLQGTWPSKGWGYVSLLGGDTARKALLDQATIRAGVVSPVTHKECHGALGDVETLRNLDSVGQTWASSSVREQ